MISSSGLPTSDTGPLREITIRLDNETWNKLISRLREIQDEMGDTDKSYSLEDYVYETIQEDLFDSDINEEDIVDIILENPGITLKEFFNKMTLK